MNRAGKRKQTEIWLREGLGKEKEKTAAEMEKRADSAAFCSGISKWTEQETVLKVPGADPAAGPLYRMDGLALAGSGLSRDHGSVSCFLPNC